MCSKLNLQDISASFHDEADLNSSCSTAMDFKPQSGIAQARQGGATRKAGWLTVKHVLTRVKSNKIELASGRKWRKYWVCLRNAALNFYHCNEKTVSSQDLDDPTFVLEIDGCIAQAVPEHAKLDHVFSVSTRLGEAYYFQVCFKVYIRDLKIPFFAKLPVPALVSTSRPLFTPEKRLGYLVA